MSVRDIDASLLALKEALRQQNEAAPEALAALSLLGCFLRDVSRIADALELIAQSK